MKKELTKQDIFELFVLRQNRNIVEIANDEKFKPKIWKTEY
ncbi:MAG: hypothetical protein WCP85_30810 [Mariniphaga sp.]